MNTPSGQKNLRSTIRIPKMDCPSEENLVRMALARQPEVVSLDFDLEARELAVTHHGEVSPILEKLAPLGLGASLVKTEQATASSKVAPSTEGEARVLKILLAINGGMFLFEFVMAWLAQSTGLLSDSLDMLADALVYGLSLYAVGKTASLQARSARLSGYFQLVLAIGAVIEVVRRSIYGSEPDSSAMVGISLLAFAANIGCMALLAKHRQGAVHMKASWIFSTNDVLANLGVIAAGLLVGWTGSHYPDLIIGFMIAGLVLSGAIRILRLSRQSA